jgi:hypothetical protein
MGNVAHRLMLSFVVLSAIGLVPTLGICEDFQNPTSGYYSGTPLGAATADPYGRNHYYVPGYALSPGLRAYQYGTGTPVYGQPYAPDRRLKNLGVENNPGPIEHNKTNDDGDNFDLQR